MLDDIDERRMTRHGVWDLLTGLAIRFEWLDVNDIGNGDDLYIKMNARGKQLSDFENIKAELEQKAQAGILSRGYEEFCRRFDQEWTDFFWSFQGKCPNRETRRIRHAVYGFPQLVPLEPMGGKRRRNRQGSTPNTR